MNSETDSQAALRAGWWISSITFLSGIGGGVVFPILPMLGVQMGLSAVVVGLILGANRITRLFFNPFTGTLVDRFGARWPVALGLFLATAGVLALSAALDSASPVAWFLTGRAVWGIGSSLIVVGALAGVVVISAQQTRGRLTSRVRTATTLGMPAGMLVGGIIADLVSPDAAFLAAAALTFATGVFALFVMPRGNGEPNAPHETRSVHGVWHQLWRNPLVQIIWCSNALISFAIVGVLLATLVVLFDARHIRVFGFDSQGSAGVLMALLMAFRAAASLAIGAFLDHHHDRGRSSPLIPGAALTAIGFGGIAVADNSWSITLALALIGVGSGALNIPLLTLLSDIAPLQTQGRAIGLYQVYRDMGGSAGPIVGLAMGARIGYGPVYAAIAGAMVALAVPLYWLARHERTRH